jgi:DNA-binding CsgD family transcriptional regulator
MICTSVDITHLKQAQFKRATLGEPARLSKNEEGVYLTKKELECIHWMIKGKSSYETGIILCISPRTVEVHINSIKRKLNCYKQFQLGYILGKYGSLLLH